MHICQQVYRCNLAEVLCKSATIAIACAGKFGDSTSVPEHSNRLKSCDIQLHDALLTCTLRTLCMWELRSPLKHVLAIKLSPMIEIRRVWQALNLLGIHPQEVDLLVVQDFTLLKTCQSVTVGLQGLRWSHGLHPNAAASPLSCWTCARPCTTPTPPCIFNI